MRNIITIIFLALALGACCTTHDHGQIGRYDLVEINAVNVVSPSVTALVAVDPETGALVPLGSGGSEGLGITAVKAGAILGGAGIIRDGLDRARELELKQ